MGALGNLGIKCQVTAEVTTMPTCTPPLPLTVCMHNMSTVAVLPGPSPCVWLPHDLGTRALICEGSQVMQYYHT